MDIKGGETVLVVALVLGAYSLPAGVLLGAWRSPWSGALRGLAASVAFLYLVNVVTLVASASWTGGPWFVAYNLAFFAMGGAGLAAVALVHRLVAPEGRAPSKALWSTAVGALAFWMAGLYGALVAPGGRPAAVFLAGTLMLAVLVVVLIVVLVVRRRDLAPGTGPWVAAGVVGLVPLMGWSVANELGGLRLPLSPGFLAWGATLVYAGLAIDLGRRSPPGPEPSFDAWCRRHGVSPREREVLELLLAGVDRSQVADRLFISPVTVKNHLAALYRKTRTSDLAALVALASHQAGDHGKPDAPAQADPPSRL